MRGVTFSVLVAALSIACDPDKAPPAGTLPSEACADTDDGVWCSDEVAIACRGGEVESEEDCRAGDRMCVASYGCFGCRPGARACDGQQILICPADGSAYQLGELCPQGSSCSERGCLNLCEEARRERSYIGCEYFPVFAANSLLDRRFRPAVVIANPNLVPAEIAISGGERSWPALRIAPEGVETVMLDYVEALQRPSGSAVVRGGAYHLTSSVPVTVHQFNPLLFEVDQDCVGEEGDSPLRVVGDRTCNSFSNDASLLLPAHVLTRPAEEPLAYLALARPTFMVRRQNDEEFDVSPGFVAVAAVGGGPVQVNVTSSASTLGSAEGADDLLPPLGPGDSLPPVTLMPGDVLQLLSAHPAECPEPLIEATGAFSCPLGADYDLTGTRIEADGPIEVIAGHNCSYVPLDRQACDHLEETMFPLDTWGVEAVAARPRGGVPQPHLVRVLSAADDNLVRFVPELAPPLRLSRGEQVELQTTEHVVVRGEKPIAVAQYLVGQGSQGRVGDPSQSLAIPSEQYRTRYAFLSPATYDANYVSIVAQAGDRVILDGAEVRSFDAIPGTSFQVASVQLRRAGAHEVHSELGSTIGVQLYGYGDFTSYMLPGGLDLRVLGPLF